MPDDTAVQRRLNKELVRRYKLEILNGRRLAALGEVAAEDYLDHAAFPGQSQGLAGFRDRLEMIIRAFGPRWTILDLVADADTAVVRWALDGIHREDFLAFPATAQRVELHGIDMYRIRSGRFAEHWNVVDLSPLATPPGQRSSSAPTKTRAFARRRSEVACDGRAVDGPGTVAR